MNKTDAKNLGSERGIAYANTIDDATLRADLDAHRAVVTERARDAALGAGFRTIDGAAAVVFIDNFVHAAGLRFLGRRAELPDVQEESRRKWVTRYLARGIENASATLATFRESFEKNACYAFEWGDDAMQAAARLDTLTRLDAVLVAMFKADEVDVDKLIDSARREVMRGAQYPGRSTSQPSNLMAQYKTAAYAEFVVECSVRF